MSEILRPITKAFWVHEEFKLRTAQEKIIEFQEVGKPLQIWWDEWKEDMAQYRNIELTSYERDEAMLQVFSLCGIDRDFHKHIRLLHRDTGLDNDLWAQETTFREHSPPPGEIFQWLGDFGSAYRDEPNDFNVGFAMDSPVGLVVVKYRSEEPFEDEDTIESGYQIALYPQDKVQEIWWHNGKFDDRA